MGIELAAIARGEALAFIGALALIVFYRGIVRGPPLASLFTGTPGGPIQSERLVLLLATLFAAGHYLSQLVTSTGAALPEVPASVLALIGASSGVYLGSKQFRQ